ncbi:MAG TPA: ABC transporter substrate-binding protein [Burkholderiales bacterium]|jgi:branched-chain amino acid transport system substrate-binding protein|nr:ABC transporter substrate-binding protein [Burkholderiales bacterium]
MMPSKQAASETPKGAKRRDFLKTAGVAAATLGAPAIVRAQAKTLNIGLLLPKSGTLAFLGQSCQKGADIAAEVCAQLGYKVNIKLMSADFESNVDLSRARAEKLIGEGAHMLVGPFDSGAAGAIAQVAEQKGVPFVINIAAAPQITEQGYKFVFRNFFTAGQLVGNGLKLMKELFVATKTQPKSAVYMHVNDTFGMANKGAIDKLYPGANLGMELKASIAYDPAARDLSVEVAKAKATGADVLMVTTRINDAILLIREMVKQRWEPMGIINPGSPGLYEQQFFASLGKYSDYCITNVAWSDPKSPVTDMAKAAWTKKFPKDPWEGNILNAGFTIEAIMICADAFQRAGSTDGKALADALRKTKIDKKIMLGGPIEFDAKGQNNNIISACLQNRSGWARVVLPADKAERPPIFPMPGWNNRGA